MAPKQGFYAVAVGRNLGVYPTWEDCEVQVKGYPAGVFKRFSTMEGECAIPLCRHSAGLPYAWRWGHAAKSQVVHSYSSESSARSKDHPPCTGIRFHDCYVHLSMQVHRSS